MKNSSQRLPKGPPPGFGEDDMFAEIDKEYRLLVEIARQAELYLYGSDIGREEARMKLQLALFKLKARQEESSKRK